MAFDSLQCHLPIIICFHAGSSKCTSQALEKEDQVISAIAMVVPQRYKDQEQQNFSDC